MPRTIKDLTGMKFGLLRVLGFAHLKGRHAYWLCRCRCGVEKAIRQDTLTMGTTLSCSCRKIAVLKRRPKAMRNRIATKASRARWGNRKG